MSKDFLSWSSVVKHSPLAIISSLSLLFSSVPVTGQNIYRWTDAQGRIHFSNAPVSVAKSIDDELPPTANFGGKPGSIPFPANKPQPVKRQVESPPTTENTSSSETAEEESTPPENNEDTAATENEQPAAQEANPASPLSQTAADSSDAGDSDETPKKDTSKNKKQSAPSDNDSDDEDDSDSSNGDDDPGDTNGEDSDETET
jgi:hypothetical protein